LRGGVIDLTNIGLSYNGGVTDDEMLFANGLGSRINCRDYVGVAGTGEMVLRGFGGAQIIASRSCFGGGVTGANLIQISHGGNASFTRCSMGSVSGDALSASSGAMMYVANSIVTGANQIARPTVPDASVIITSSRLSHAANAVVPTSGIVSIDTASSIRHCTSSIVLTGTVGGTVFGNPTIADCTNAAPTPHEIAATGALWMQSNVRPRLAGTTVTQLPGSPLAGMEARVTDASAPTIGSTVVGGGGAHARVWYNGSNWTVTGV
jgi:hypothetical protein